MPEVSKPKGKVLFLFPRSGTNLVLRLLESDEGGPRLPVISDTPHPPIYKFLANPEDTAVVEEGDPLSVVHFGNDHDGRWADWVSNLPSTWQVAAVVRDGRNCVASWHTIAPKSRFEDLCQSWKSTAQTALVCQRRHEGRLFQFETIAYDTVDGVSQILHYF